MRKSKRIVLINPITETISKTYESKNDIFNDLKLDNVTNITNCFYHRANQFKGYILKYEEDATPENIKIYSDKHNIGLNGERRCPMCKKWFEKLCPIYCNLCGDIQRKEFASTKKGFLQNVSHAMKNNSNKKLKMGRIDAGICNVDYQYLIDMFDEQKGCCFYSGLQMTHIPTTNWQCSPERLDETKGYVDGNIKLICLEFNTGHVQWSKNKILQIKELSENVLDFDNLKEKVENAKNVENIGIKKTRRVRKPIIVIDDETLYHCLQCDTYFNIEYFNSSKQGDKRYIDSFCITCYSIIRDKYKKSLRGFLIMKINAAKFHCNKIAKNKKRTEENAKFELTLDIILHKILEQKGRCFYSNIPLVYSIKSDWSMSIERLDSKQGYTQLNCVLICVEFNSTDVTSITDKSSGSGQWSKSKFDFFIKNMKV